MRRIPLLLAAALVATPAAAAEIPAKTIAAAALAFGAGATCDLPVNAEFIGTVLLTEADGDTKVVAETLMVIRRRAHRIIEDLKDADAEELRTACRAVGIILESIHFTSREFEG